MPSIQEKLKVEAERRQQQRLDNEDLRGKLVSFAEQAKLRCVRASHLTAHTQAAWVTIGRVMVC